MSKRKSIFVAIGIFIGGLLLSPFVGIAGWNEELVFSGMSAIYSFFVVEHYVEHEGDVASFTDGYTLIHRDAEGKMISYDDGNIHLIFE